MEKAGRKTNWVAGRDWLLTGASVVLLWVAFYTFGQMLKLIPAKVHEGTVWSKESSP